MEDSLKSQSESQNECTYFCKMVKMYMFLMSYYVFDNKKIHRIYIELLYRHIVPSPFSGH